MSETMVKDDVYTSVHIEEQTIQFRKSKVGDDELSLEIPNVSVHAKRNLDSKGIIRVGSEVQAGDVPVWVKYAKKTLKREMMMSRQRNALRRR